MSQEQGATDFPRRWRGYDSAQVDKAIGELRNEFAGERAKWMATRAEAQQVHDADRTQWAAALWALQEDTKNAQAHWEGERDELLGQLTAMRDVATSAREAEAQVTELLRTFADVTATATERAETRAVEIVARAEQREAEAAASTAQAEIYLATAEAKRRSILVGAAAEAEQVLVQAQDTAVERCEAIVAETGKRLDEFHLDRAQATTLLGQVDELVQACREALGAIGDLQLPAPVVQLPGSPPLLLLPGSRHRDAASG